MRLKDKLSRFDNVSGGETSDIDTTVVVEMVTIQMMIGVLK